MPLGDSAEGETMAVALDDVSQERHWEVVTCRSEVCLTVEDGGREAYLRVLGSL